MNSENTITPCHHHRQEETRTLIRDSLSLALSVCVHSLSLSLCSCCCCCLFHFSPQKWALDTKIKTLFPSSLSLVLDESIRSSSAQTYMLQLCDQRTPRVLHKGREGCFFVIIAARCLFFVHTRERERERERERRARKNDADEKFVSTKYAKRGKKTRCRCRYCFSAATRERER